MDDKFSRRAFAIMPFSKTKSCTEAQWTDIFENVFKPAVEGAGYICERALPTTGSLVKSVIQDLVYSRIVIADITDRNANVFYELGVRHAVSKRTIMVTQDVEHIPSDLRGHWSLVYSVTPGGVATFKREIARLIGEIDQDPEKNDSPVSEFLDHEATGVRHYLARDNIKRISALFAELSAIVNTLNELSENMSLGCMIEHGCIDLLLNSLYIDVGVHALKDFYHLRHNLKIIRNGLRQDHAFISETVTLSGSVMGLVFEVRKDLLSGRFVEPTQISSMVWAPVTRESSREGETSINARYSTAVDLTNISAEDLRKPSNKT